MDVDMFMGLLAIIVVLLLIRLVLKKFIQRLPALIPSPSINQEAFISLFQGVGSNLLISGAFARFSIVSLGIAQQEMPRKREG